jgi:hypothetical protein
MSDEDEKPTSISVTAVPCKCNWLAQAADEPDNPVVFDKEMNEYHLAHQRPRGSNGAGGGRYGYSMIYHCPFCGGAAPKSKRETFFANITDAERARLTELTAGIRTVADAIARLGPPDQDVPQGLTVTTPATDTTPSTVTSYRVIRYMNLSETASVEFTDYGPDRGVRMTLQSKYIGSKK